jgi:hypothetical protein
MEEIRIRDEKKLDPEYATLIMTFNVFVIAGAWRVSMANQDFKLCPTYPQVPYPAFCLTSLF